MEVQIKSTWREFLCTELPINDCVEFCNALMGGPLICHKELYGINSHAYNSKENNGNISCTNLYVEKRYLYIESYKSWITDIHHISTANSIILSPTLCIILSILKLYMIL